jgi:hypothetical protein
MRDRLVDERFLHGGQMQLRFFLSRKEGHAGQKYQAGPALAQAARHLGQLQFAVREGTVTAGIKIDSAGGSCGYGLGIVRRGWDQRGDCRGNSEYSGCG